MDDYNTRENGKDDFNNSNPDSRFDDNSVHSHSDGLYGDRDLEKTQFSSINNLDEGNNKDKSNINVSKKKGSFFKSLRKVFVITVCSVLCGSVAGFGIGLGVHQIQDYVKYEQNFVNNNKYAEAAEVSSYNSKSNSEKLSGVAEIIKKVQPAVVSINSVVSSKDLFSMPSQSTTVGSGIIFHQTSSNVYIVTNYHVVYNASDVSVSVNGSGVVPAAFVGKGTTDDLAVISVSKEDLKTVGVNSVVVAKFGNTDSVNVGDGVIAIGNALGDGDTATRGIISAFHKDSQSESGEIGILQTDAAINPGNDGGALVNGRGEVIGINTSKYSATTVEGVGYAIPVNVAKPVIEQLMNKTETPKLGVQVSSVSSEDAERIGLVGAGVLVEEVVNGSSAEKAGIKVGDIITGFNNTPVFNPNQLVEAVQKCKVGDDVEIKLLRVNSNRQTVVVVEAVLQKDMDTSF